MERVNAQNPPGSGQPSINDAIRKLTDQLMAEHDGDAATVMRILNQEVLPQLFDGSGGGAAFGLAAAQGRRTPDDEEPFELLPEPAQPVVFRVRVDLDGADPAIWRRLDLAGDLPLPRVHTLLQAAFGWLDCHLHMFRPARPGQEPQRRPFANVGTADFCADDLPEEDEVRLDQVVARPGDRLLYEYDFGDSWEHLLVVEEVGPRAADEPRARLLDGERSGPPEDCGGIWSYNEVVAALAGRPPASADQDWLREQLAWLPEGFDPEDTSFMRVDLGELLDTIDRAERLVDLLVDNPRLVPIAHDLIARVDRADQLPALAVLVGDTGLDLTAEPVAAARAQVIDGLTADEAAQLMRPWTLLLQFVGTDGLALTQAGRLPPKVVQALFDGLDLGRSWIGKGNREDQTLPVALLREAATAMGLVRKAKGRLVPSKAAASSASDPVALWQVVADGLSRVRDPFAREATALSLLCLAGDQPMSLSLETMGVGLLGSLGWRTDDEVVSAHHVRWASDPVWTVMTYGGLGEDGVSTPAGRRLARAALCVH